MEKDRISYLPKMQKENIGEDINLLLRDGDPRKTAYVVGMSMDYHKVVKIWKDFGVLDKINFEDQPRAVKDSKKGQSVKLRKSGWQERQHMAPEHCLTVAVGCRVLGKKLLEKNLINDFDLKELESAALIHDAGKFLEYKLVLLALSDRVDEDEFVNFVKSQFKYYDEDSGIKKDVHETLAKMHLYNNESGTRGLLAYDLAGRVNAKRLRAAGVNINLVEMQRMVGHSSCPEVEEMVDNFDSTSQSNKNSVITTLVLHYIDDIVTNPNIIDPTVFVGTDGSRQNALDRRCGQNEDNPKYVDYNNSWPLYSLASSKETAFQMQRRVGHKVEKLLANLLSVENPLTLPQVINDEMEKEINDNWKKIISATKQR